MNLFNLLRMLVGLLFIVSGTEKLIGPYQNFLYVVQSYEVLNPALEELTARVFPWIELFVGIFLFLGLWLKAALSLAVVMVLTFLSVVGQAIFRNLPITECGCFGQLISFPLETVFLIDSSLLFILIVLLIKLNKASALSLDNYFQRSI